MHNLRLFLSVRFEIGIAYYLFNANILYIFAQYLNIDTPTYGANY